MNTLAWDGADSPFETATRDLREVCFPVHACVCACVCVCDCLYCIVLYLCISIATNIFHALYPGIVT